MKISTQIQKLKFGHDRTQEDADFSDPRPSEFFRVQISSVTFLPLILFIPLLLTACTTANPQVVFLATPMPTVAEDEPTAAPTSAPTTPPADPTPAPTPAPTTPPAQPTAVPASPTPEVAASPPGTPAPLDPNSAMAAAQRRTLKPNELGVILVLEYHLIEQAGNDVYTRTPASLRADLDWLYANRFYPIRFRDLTSGQIDIPIGKSPVVLTFDDSSIGQFRYLDDGTIDPESAMGILLDFAAAHPDFPAVATFFPLLDVDVDSRILWGQPELANQKLRVILEHGGEIGSHTVSHERLDLATEARTQWQLAMSSLWLEQRIADEMGSELSEPYKIISLALPLGGYPPNEALLYSGESEGATYAFSGAAEVAGGPTRSPYAVGFDPYHIFRTQIAPGYIEGVLSLLEQRPSLKYVSDGNPNVITVPTEATLDVEQQGLFDAAAWSDDEIIRYERQ